MTVIPDEVADRFPAITRLLTWGCPYIGRNHALGQEVYGEPFWGTGEEE